MSYESSTFANSLCMDWPETTQGILNVDFLNEEELLNNSESRLVTEESSSELPSHESIYNYSDMEEQKQKILSGSPSPSSAEASGKKKRRSPRKMNNSNSCRRRKKPIGMPKRPLSAYNIFFKTQKVIVQSRAMNDKKEGSKGLGFEGLGKIIGKKWKQLGNEDRKKYQKLAEEDSVRYRRAMDAYKNKKEAMEKQIFEKVLSSVAGLEADHRKLPNDRSISGPTINAGVLDTRQTGTAETLFESANPLYSARNPRPMERQGLTCANKASLSPPPPAVVVQPQFGSSGHFPLPPGMEIVLSDSSGKDRKFIVEYKYYEMSRAEANTYIKSVGARPFSPPKGVQHTSYPPNYRG